jgi:hypothetical protein
MISLRMPIYTVLALTQLSSDGVVPTATADHGAIQTILSIVFGAIGALALLMITVSGLRYVTSAGDPDKMKRARDGIIYSLVGLTIAIVAESIVGYVAGNI